MSNAQAARLADGFAPARREAWLSLVERTLKGAPFETLVSHTPDGLDIQPLYTAEDAQGRLITGAAVGSQPWDIRSTVDEPNPAVANQHALEDLEGGANSILLRLDAAGQAGCAIGDATGLAASLSGVMLEVATVALDAGWAGPQAAGWLAEAAKGSPTARLALHLDPLSAWAEEGVSPGPIEAHLEAAAQTAAPLLQTYPQATAFLATGAAVHEAGGTEAQELGFMAASLVAYAKALGGKGLDPAAAMARVAVGVVVDGEYFSSIAKLRAARLICDRLVEACRSPGDSIPQRGVAIEARSSRRMLSRVDAWTNLLRLTAAGFAAATGGADAVVLAPFTQPLGRPTALARRQARNIQLLLMQESHVGRVRDPAAGAWSIEAMTTQLARQAWAVFQGIERAGGPVAALQSGLIAANVEGARAALRSAAEQRGVLGVTRFPNPQERPAPTEAAPAMTRVTLDVRLPGADTLCPALKPMRIAEAYEDFDGALT